MTIGETSLLQFVGFLPIGYEPESGFVGLNSRNGSHILLIQLVKLWFSPTITLTQRFLSHSKAGRVLISCAAVTTDCVRVNGSGVSRLPASR